MNTRRTSTECLSHGGSGCFSISESLAHDLVRVNKWSRLLWSVHNYVSEKLGCLPFIGRGRYLLPPLHLSFCTVVRICLISDSGYVGSPPQRYTQPWEKRKLLFYLQGFLLWRLDRLESKNNDDDSWAWIHFVEKPSFLRSRMCTKFCKEFWTCNEILQPEQEPLFGTIAAGGFQPSLCIRIPSIDRNKHMDAWNPRSEICIRLVSMVFCHVICPSSPPGALSVQPGLRMMPMTQKWIYTVIIFGCPAASDPWFCVQGSPHLMSCGGGGSFSQVPQPPLS